jgi:hypothetical protein
MGQITEPILLIANLARQKNAFFFEVIQLFKSLFDMFISNTLSDSASSPSGDETSI